MNLLVIRLTLGLASILVADCLKHTEGSNSNSIHGDFLCYESTRADVVFVLDGSQCIGEDNWELMLHFAADIAEDLSYAHVDVRFAIVFFERRQPYKYDFKEFRDLTSVIRAIMRLPYSASRGSFLHRALRMINDQDMFGDEAGSRHDAEKVVMVMTDGRWKNERQTLFAAEELKKHGVIFVSVAVGHHPEMNELKCLATCPRYVFNIDCFDLLLVFKIDLMRITCKDVPITSDLVSRAVPTESSGPIYVSSSQHEVFTLVHKVSQDFSTESNTKHIQSQSFRTDLTIASSHAVVTTTQIALQTLNTQQLFESSTEPLIKFSKEPSLSTEPLRNSSTIPHLTTALESTESPHNLTTKPALKPTTIPDLTTEPATLTSESPRNSTKALDLTTEPAIESTNILDVTTKPAIESTKKQDITTEPSLQSTKFKNLTTEPSLQSTKFKDLTTEPFMYSTKILDLTSESVKDSTILPDLTTKHAIESSRILDVTTDLAIESTKIQDLTTEPSLQSTKFKDLTTEPSLQSTKFKDLTTEPFMHSTKILDLTSESVKDSTILPDLTTKHVIESSRILDVTTDLAIESTKIQDLTTEPSLQSKKFKDLTTEPAIHSTKILDLTSESAKYSTILPDLTTKHAIESSRIPDLTTEPAKVFTKTPEFSPEPVLKSTKLSELTNQPAIESTNILDLTTEPFLQSTKFKDLITEPAIHSTKIQDLTSESATDSTVLPDVTTKHAIESSKILVLTSEPAKNATSLSDSIPEPAIESTKFQESTSESPTKPSKLPDLTSKTALESSKIPNLTSEPARTSTKLPDLTTVTPKIIDLTTEHAIESTKLHNVTTKSAIKSTKILDLTTEHAIESTRKLSFTTEPAMDSTKSPDSRTEPALDSTKRPDFTTEPAIESTKITNSTTKHVIDSTKLSDFTSEPVIESTKLPAIESSKLPDVTSGPTIESSMLPVVKTEAANESSKLPVVTTNIFMESKSLIMNSKSSLVLLSSDKSIIPSIDSTSTLDVNTKYSEETTSIVDPKTKPYLESSTVIFNGALSKESALTFDSSTKSAKETSTFLESTKIYLESTTSKKTLFYVSTEPDLESSMHFDHSSKHFIDLTPSSDVGSISDFKSSSTSHQSTELSKGSTPTFQVITESDMSSYIESSLSSDVTNELNTELTPSVKETIGSLLNSNTESTPLLDLTIGPTIESLSPLHISTGHFMKSTQMIDLNTKHVRESTLALDLSIEPATQYSTLIILSSNPSGESTLSLDLSTKTALKSTRSLNLSTEPANSTQTLDLSTESGLKSIQSFDVSTKPVMESTQSLDLSTEPVLKSIQSLDLSTEPAKSTQSLDLSTKPAKSTQSLDLSTEPAKSIQSLDVSTEPANSTHSLDLSTEPVFNSTQSLDLSTEPAKSTQSLDLSTEPAKSTKSLDLSTEPAKSTQSLDLSTEPAKSTQSLDLSTEPAKSTQSLDLSTEPAKSTQSLDLSTEPAKSTQSLDLSTEPAKSTQSLDLSTESAFNAFKSIQSLDVSTEPVLQSTQSIDLSTEPVVDTTSEYPYRFSSELLFTQSIFSSWHLQDVSGSPSLLSHDDQAQMTLHLSLPSSLIKPGISPVSLPNSALATPPPTSQPCPQHAQLDIMLILEASPGTGSRNWVSLIKFVIDLIYSFNIGPDNVKFGAIFSSQEPVKQCDFNTYQTVSSLLKAILSIQFPRRSETNTYKALQLITQDRMFSVEAGGRVSAKDVVIVITDGNSTFPIETQNAADDLKKNGVTIYTVGVGPYVNEKLLQDVATSPGQFIKSDSFGSLDINMLKILEVACSNHSSSITVPTLLTTSELSAVQFSWSTEAITSTTIMPHESTFGITVTPSPTIPQCPDLLQLDIILVLDASSSIIRDKDWNYLTKAVGQLISSLPIGPRNIRFGVVYFNRRVTKVCDLKTYDSKEGLYNAVTQIKYPYVAGTHTHRALDQIINDDMFSSKSGGREEAKDVVIVVTDGWSNFPLKTLNSARELKISGVTVISVGVGTGISMAELQGMASGPDDVILASNFQALEAVSRDLIRILCRDMMSTINAVASLPSLSQSSFMDIVFTQPNSITTSISCKSSEETIKAAATVISTVQVCPDAAEADIILVLDASLSIGAKNWPFLTKVAGEITSRFTISQEKVRFGAIFFNRKPTKLFDLKTYNNNRDVNDALVSIKYPHISRTHTDKALDVITTDQMFSSQSGGRDSAKDLVIVITDGYSNYPEKTQESAAELKKQGITVISVGFGPDVSMTELEGMSSGPGLVYLASDFRFLQDIQTQLIQRLCQIMSSSAMLPSPCLTYSTYTAQITLPTVMSTHPSMVYACRDLTCLSDLKEINTPATALVQTELTPYKVIYITLSSEMIESNANILSTIINYTLSSLYSLQDLTNIARSSLLQTEMTSTNPIQPSWSSESTELEKTTKLVHTTNVLSRSLQHPTESFSDDLVKQSASSSPTSFAFHNTLQPSWTSEITIQHESSESLSGVSIISTTSAFIPSCSDSVQLDIVLVLDASSSIGLKNWTYLTQTAGDIITRFPVGVRFAVITFNVRANKIFDLNTYNTTNDVYNAVIKIPYVHISGTHTHRALEMVIRDQMFSRERGGRDEAYDVVIVITDGRSNFPNKTYEAASELKKLGITIMSVGVGQEISMTELQGMASSPNLVILAKDYPSLDVIKSKLIQRVCEIPEHMNSTVSVGLMTKTTALQCEKYYGNLLAVP